MNKQIHIYIKGSVTGVSFRYFTAGWAQRLNIKGWVKNVYGRPEIFGLDGGVEAVFQGNNENIKKMIEKVKEGPPAAWVKVVETVEEEMDENIVGFEVRR